MSLSQPPVKSPTKTQVAPVDSPIQSGDRPSRTTILQIEVDALTRGQILETARIWLCENRPTRQIITVNSLMILEATKKAEFARLLREASLVVPDSYGMLWASRRLGRPLPCYTPGIELMLDLCRLCAESGLGAYFMGGKPGIAEAAAKNLQALCPGLKVAGHWHGYFSPGTEENGLLQNIRQARPGVLFVGLGVPRQEFWIRRHISQLGALVAIGVGGSLDVYAGKLRRAPRWLKDRGLEWSYRLVQEPSRLSRILKLPLFALAVIRERLRVSKSGTGR